MRHIAFDMFSITKYPLTDAGGNAIPWFSLDEFLAYKNKTEFLFKASQFKNIADEANSNIKPITATNLPVIILPSSVKDLVKELALFFVFINDDERCLKHHVANSKSLSVEKYVGQVDQYGEILPFLIDRHEHSNVSFTNKNGRNTPAEILFDDNYKAEDGFSPDCDYLANPFIYYPPCNDGLKIFTIRCDALPVSVLAFSEEEIIRKAANHCKLLPVTPETNKLVIPKSWDSVLDMSLPNAVLTSSDRWCSYQYVKTREGDLFEKSTAWGKASVKVELF